MVVNKRVPSLSQNSESESSEDTLCGFTTLSGGSFVVGGVSKAPSLVQPSPGRENPLLTLELNEGVTPHSSKRSKGRPQGSKNKPKPPIIIREDDDTTLKSVVIEIPIGNDIAKTLINFAQHHNVSITVLSGSGLVSDITLLHPASRSPTFPIKGPMNMTSFFGTYINANCGSVPPQFITNLACSSFSIFLAGAQGQVLGGIVGGKVMSAGHVLVTATLFKKPKFQRAAFINGRFEEIEVGDPRYASNVLINVDRTSIEPNNNNGNNTVVASTFSVVGLNSMSLNRQLLQPHPDDVNVMQWNLSGRPNYY